MRKMKVIFSLAAFLLMTTLAWGVSSTTGKWHAPSSALRFDATVTLDANSLEMFIANYGNFAYDPGKVMGKIDGLYFPRGTKKTVIYAAGFWVGAKVEDQVRIAMAEYSSEFAPGPMKNGTFQPDSPAYKVYKIKRGDNESNPDYRDWPVDQGAPYDTIAKAPILLGDVMTWSSCNDADITKHTNRCAGTSPLGIEVHQTAFAYARGGALGNTAFVKFKIINNGGNRLDSTYVSLWADPDLGDAGDDLVGCDTALSLGYCYNSGADPIYGSAAPAVGFDFFQGPIVPGNATDTAYVSGVPRPGYRNLPMTAFSKYINGEDPQGYRETYLFMKGYRKLNGQMVPAVDPNGDTTTFVYAGDPQTGEGWLDVSPADRRYMMTSGPFTMMPGDTQEVVAAVIVGQGSDPLNSIGALKLNDVQAQAVFNLNFEIPPPPPPPTIWVRGGDQEVDIIWDASPIEDVQISENLNQEFHFEGFNLYQGVTAVGPWTKFATFDKDDDAAEVALIYNDLVNPAAGGIQRVIVQTGSNSGLEYHYNLTANQIDGTPLDNNKPYYFAVTSYSYDYRHVAEFTDPAGNLLGHLTETLESPIVAYEMSPFTQVGGYRHIADHVSGISDGEVQIDYIYPDSVIDADYRVTFDEDLNWDLTNLTTQQTLLADQTNQSGDYLYDIVNGIMVSVKGPNPGIRGTRVHAAATSTISFDVRQAYMDGRNVKVNTNYDNFKLVFEAGPEDTVQVEWFDGTDTWSLIRYLDSEGDTIWAYFNGAASDADRVSVPFKLYDIGTDTLNPTPVQLWPLVYDFYGDYNFYIDDYIVFLSKNITGNKVTEDFFSMPDRGKDEYWGFDPADPISRHDWDYRIGFGVTATWTQGDSIVFITYKGNIPDDVFEFSTSNTATSSGDFVKLSLDDIKVVPNPYYNFSPLEIDQFDRMLKFINLPPVALKIRIFNIAGDLLRTMERTDIYNPEFIWDLKTDNGLWVASGIYIWLIEGEGLGQKYGKMAIFTEVEQLDTF